MKDPKFVNSSATGFDTAFGFPKGKFIATLVNLEEKHKFGTSGKERKGFCIAYAACDGLNDARTLNENPDAEWDNDGMWVVASPEWGEAFGSSAKKQIVGKMFYIETAEGDEITYEDAKGKERKFSPIIPTKYKAL